MYTEKRDKYSDNIDKVRTQKMCSIVGSEIPDVKTDDGTLMEGKNNPVRHKPSGASLSDLRNQRDPYRPFQVLGI